MLSRNITIFFTLLGTDVNWGNGKWHDHDLPSWKDELKDEWKKFMQSLQSLCSKLNSCSPDGKEGGDQNQPKERHVAPGIRERMRELDNNYTNPSVA